MPRLGPLTETATSSAVARPFEPVQSAHCDDALFGGQSLMAGRADTRPDVVDERAVVQALRKLRRGVFSVRLPAGQSGVLGEIADGINDVAELNERVATELDRITRVVGREGRVGQRASIGEVSGAWARQIEAINGRTSGLTEATDVGCRDLEALATE